MSYVSKEETDKFYSGDVIHEFLIDENKFKTAIMATGDNSNFFDSFIDAIHEGLLSGSVMPDELRRFRDATAIETIVGLEKWGDTSKEISSKLERMTQLLDHQSLVATFTHPKIAAAFSDQSKAHYITWLPGMVNSMDNKTIDQIYAGLKSNGMDIDFSDFLSGNIYKDVIDNGNPPLYSDVDESIEIQREIKEMAARKQSGFGEPLPAVLDVDDEMTYSNGGIPSGELPAVLDTMVNEPAPLFSDIDGSTERQRLMAEAAAFRSDFSMYPTLPDNPLDDDITPRKR